MAAATHCAGTCSSSFTHQKRLASHFGTDSNVTDSSCAGTRRLSNIFFLNLRKSPCHPRCILPFVNSCPSLPHSFPDLNCKTITLHKQRVECRPLNSWSCTTALGLCADTTNMSGGSNAGTSRHHRGEQPAPGPAFPAFHCYSLSLPSCHLHCQVLVGRSRSPGSRYPLCGGMQTRSICPGLF